jgi:hypothetical protein
MIDMRSLHAGMMIGAFLTSTGWEINTNAIASMLRSYNKVHAKGTPLTENEIEEICAYLLYYEGYGEIKP